MVCVCRGCVCVRTHSHRVHGQCPAQEPSHRPLLLTPLLSPGPPGEERCCIKGDGDRWTGPELVPGPQLRVRKRGSEGRWGWGGVKDLVYIGSVHGRHVIVRLVQCLGSFVHLEKKQHKLSLATELTYRQTCFQEGF